MSESTGGALLLDIAVIMMGAMIAVFVASFAYSKAYRAKTMIIDVIEKTESDSGYVNDDTYREEVESIFKNLGYTPQSKTCGLKEKYEGQNYKNIVPGQDYYQNKYCVGRIDSSDNDGNTYYFYAVETYMYFDIPLIKFSIPVRGETKTFYDTFVDIEGEERDEE